MLFRQLFDADSSTYTYLLADPETREAVLIDSVIGQVERDVKLLNELGLSLKWVLDTHVHADHVTGAGVLRERLGCQSVLSEKAGAVCADRLVKEGDEIAFGGYALRVLETPGHTSGCLTFVTKDGAMAFTGDALLIRGCGRTDFQQGDSRTLYRSVTGKILALAPETVIYPGHDYRGHQHSTVAEERAHNPRLGGGKTEEDFVTIMKGLKLAHPRKMDVAVPENLRCGMADGGGTRVAAYEGGWGEITPNAVGIPEVSAEWVREHGAEVVLIDVREPDEYRGELGHVPQSLLVPLGTLSAAAARLPGDKPIVAICRSGGRSAKAAEQLARLEHARVASMAGGMLRVNELRLPIAYGPPDGVGTNRQG